MSAPTDQALEHALRPLTSQPAGAAIFCDVDGTLAPIVSRPDDSRVDEETSALLGRLRDTYASVACVSGRSAGAALRLVGVEGITYVGSHGAEILEPGAAEPELTEGFAAWEGRVRSFVSEKAATPDARRLEVRVEDKGPIKAFHWRGVAHEAAAQSLLEGVAEQATAEGLKVHWGRKVLEIRPPLAVHKGQAVRTLLARRPASAALYAGDDMTDLDAFGALAALTASGTLSAAVRVGVRSREGPAAIVDEADLVVDGVPGVIEVLAALAHAVR